MTPSLHSLRPAGSRGFTILELMIVLLIIAVLVALGLAKFAPATNAAKSAQANVDVRNALNDAMAFFTVNGSFTGLQPNDLPSVSDTAPTEVGSCSAANAGDVADAAASAGEGQLQYCASGSDFAVAAQDHTANEWSAEIHDGTIVVPNRATAGSVSPCVGSTELNGSDWSGAFGAPGRTISAVCVSGSTLTVHGSGLSQALAVQILYTPGAGGPADLMVAGTGATAFAGTDLEALYANLCPTPIADPGWACHDNAVNADSDTQVTVDISSASHTVGDALVSDVVLLYGSGTLAHWHVQ